MGGRVIVAGGSHKMLTSSALVQVGPLMLETAIKHYLDRKSVTKDSEAREEFLFDEAFVLVKRFLEIASKHTVEDLQAFSQAKTPSPPWVLTHHVLVPMPTCTIAAEYLVKALGGEKKALEMCGGTRWWTVRLTRGVECEWIGIKKDIIQEEERVAKHNQLLAREASSRNSGIETPQSSATPATRGEGESGSGHHSAKDADDIFTPEMDSQRCTMYIHGGAFYWGSINTHRYSIWRHARKSRGRAFACNYRKAPQYPFPCALLDVLAAYLFLLNPPLGAEHRPVDPKRLTLAGDSAGGGLVLSLLQVLRDLGLPQPAGAILISPWCDLTHSFPSVMANTSSDIIPPYGFIHKPSTLWPPPPPQLSEDIQGRIKERVKEAVHRFKRGPGVVAGTSSANIQGPDLSSTAPTGDGQEEEPTTGRGDTLIAKGDDATLFPVHEKGIHHQPTPDETHPHSSTADPASHADIMSILIDGKETTIRSQIQLYATNSQLAHPYVSPALGYLGGLCPLMVIASEKEVLRDEIVYMAHKAADPGKYPVREGVKDMLPSLAKLDPSSGVPTQVHLQIYDDTCHVLPLFSMCEPAKHCYRAIAAFNCYITSRQASMSSVSTSLPQQIQDEETTQLPVEKGTPRLPVSCMAASATDEPESIAQPVGLLNSEPGALSLTESPAPSIYGSRPGNPSRSASGPSRAYTTETLGPDDDSKLSNTAPRMTLPAGNLLDNRFPADEVRMPATILEGHAGHFGIYAGWEGDMLRERVSRKGVCRTLEDPRELSCLLQPLEEIGVLREGPVKRYLQGQALWDEKFKSTAKRIEKRRQEHIKKAQSEAGKAIKMWKDKVEEEKITSQKSNKSFEEIDYMTDNEFSWTWALRGESPPPTAIIARRDTPEWRTLALQADRMTDINAHLSGLTLWTAIAGFFSKETGPMTAAKPSHPHKTGRSGGSSKFGALWGGGRKRPATTPETEQEQGGSGPE